MILNEQELANSGCLERTRIGGFNTKNKSISRVNQSKSQNPLIHIFIHNAEYDSEVLFFVPYLCIIAKKSRTLLRNITQYAQFFDFSTQRIMSRIFLHAITCRIWVIIACHINIILAYNYKAEKLFVGPY